MSQKLVVGETRIVVVKANEEYSGYPLLKVSVGEKYSFLVNQLDRWKHNWFSSTSKGRISFYPKKTFRCSTANKMELCMTIDKNDDDHTFPIGQSVKIEIPKDGDLYFFSNDRLQSRSNNSGQILVKVKREH